MKIEVLYKEVCNLYGDTENIEYLKKCIPEAEFIYTSLNDEPYFVKNDVNLIYMGSMSENIQEVVIKKLSSYKSRIKELIDKNVVFLITGNAIEVFGNYIEDEGKKIPCLKIFNFYTKRNLNNRYNSMFLGNYNDIKIVGFKHQFTKIYTDDENFNYFIDVIRGMGINNEVNKEGIKVNNFFGTQLIGPILLLNPYFTEYLLKLLNCKNKLVYKKEAIDAYNRRLFEFENVKSDI